MINPTGGRNSVVNRNILFDSHVTENPHNHLTAKNKFSNNKKSVNEIKKAKMIKADRERTCVQGDGCRVRI
jgi:hypothetical protein